MPTKEWIVPGLSTIEGYQYLSKITDGVTITETDLDIVSAGGFRSNQANVFNSMHRQKQITCHTSEGRQETFLMLKYPDAYVISISLQELE